MQLDCSRPMYRTARAFRATCCCCLGKDELKDGADDPHDIGPGPLEYPTPVTLEELGDRNPLLAAPSDPETHKRMLDISNAEEVVDDQKLVGSPHPSTKKKKGKRPKAKPAYQLDAKIVVGPGVTVSGLQPVQIFEGESEFIRYTRPVRSGKTNLIQD